VESFRSDDAGLARIAKHEVFTMYVQAPALDEARVISMGQIPAKARILHR
jgi:hypothetical protein